MHRPRFASLAVVFALVAAGCSDNPTPEPIVPPAPIDSAGFMNAYAKVLCDNFARCSPVAELLQASCDGTVRQTFGEDPMAAIESGKIIYDANAAGACVAGLAATDCLAEQLSDATSNACLSALQGTVAPGQPCFGTFECAEGICPIVSGDQCPAVCPTIAKKGEACSLLGGPDCDARDGLRCSQGTCVVPLGEGAACQDNFGCTSGHVCVTNLCVPLRGLQQGCAKDSSCEVGLYCASGGDEGGACHARLDAGQPCGGVEADDANAAFRHVQCKDGLVCAKAILDANGVSAGGTCELPRDIGGDCTVWPMGAQLFETGCKMGLVCNAGKCDKPPTVGGTCAENSVCLHQEAYCEPMTTTCTALKANGETCTADYECAGTLCGSMGQCTDRVTFCAP